MPSWFALGATSLVAGVVGALAVRFVALPPSPEVHIASAADEVDASPGVTETESDDDEVQALRRRLAQVERKMSLLTAGMARGALLDGEALDHDPDGSALSDIEVTDPVFVAAVVDILDQEQERKEEERTAYRSALRVERSRRAAVHLGTQLSLSDEQQTRVAEAMQRTHEAMRDLRQSDDRPVTRREWREKLDTFRAEFNEQLAEILTSDQLETYEALPSEDKIELGGGRRRPPRTSSAGTKEAR